MHCECRISRLAFSVSHDSPTPTPTPASSDISGVCWLISCDNISNSLCMLRFSLVISSSTFDGNLLAILSPGRERKKIMLIYAAYMPNFCRFFRCSCYFIVFLLVGMSFTEAICRLGRYVNTYLRNDRVVLERMRDQDGSLPRNRQRCPRKMAAADSYSLFSRHLR